MKDVTRKKKKKSKGMKSCMPWIGAKRRRIDEKGDGMHEKRNVNTFYLIGVFFGSVCDKEVAETHEKECAISKSLLLMCMAIAWKGLQAWGSNE